MRDFRPRLNKQGKPYGWSIAIVATPEAVFGEELVTAAYGEEPATSWERIFEHTRELYPDADEKDIRKVLGLKGGK